MFFFIVSKFIFSKIQFKISLILITSYWLLLSTGCYLFARKLIEGRLRKVFRPLPKTLFKQQYIPFIRSEFDNWDRQKIYLNCYLKFPLRFTLLFDVISSAAVLINLIVLIEKLKGSRSPILRTLMKMYVRIYPSYVLKKFCNLEEIQINKQSERDPIIISNHVSWYQSVFVILKYWPVSVILADNLKSFPFLGSILNYLDCIYIYRDNQNSRNSVLQQIKQRVDNIDKKNLSPILIFPEGTTTNGQCLIHFKKGAFQTLSPIKLIAIDYKVDKFNPTLDLIGFAENIIFFLLHDVSARVFIKHNLKADDDNIQKYIEKGEKQMSQILGKPILAGGYRHKQEYFKIQRSS